MSFRNRCQLAGADGIIQLSIPLEQGRNQRTIMKEVRIANRQKWQARHWKTIVSCYSRSPWFEFYQDDLLRLYRRPFIFLLDWDRECFEWATRMLGMTPDISLTASYHEDYDEKEWLDLRGKIGPRTIRQLQAAETSGGNLAIPTPGGETPSGSPATPEADLPEYRQVFEERTGFLPGLSILDLIFCQGGKHAASLLKG